MRCSGFSPSITEFMADWFRTFSDRIQKNQESGSPPPGQNSRLEHDIWLIFLPFQELRAGTFGVGGFVQVLHKSEYRLLLASGFQIFRHAPPESPASQEMPAIEVERGKYRFVHVAVCVSAQPSTDDDILLPRC